MNKRSYLEIGIVVLLFGIILYLGGKYLPPAVDWHTAFRPAAWEIISGRSPYNIAGYFNAPWALLPLLPIALLPEVVGRSILAAISMVSFAFTAKRLGGNTYAVVLLLLSPPVIHGVLQGNIDWLAALGFIMPPQIGLLFVVIKPQIGIGVAIYWLFDAWKTGGITKVVKVFWPLTVMTLLSFLLFGFWPLRFEQEISLWWNASLWPASIPVGLALLVAGIRKQKINYAIGASPCLSPYVLLHSWVGALLAIVGSLPEFIATFIGLWLLVVIRYFGWF